MHGWRPLASAELYDPATGTWSATGPLPSARHLHTATLLPNGQVLVAGGLAMAAPWPAPSSTTRLRDLDPHRRPGQRPRIDHTATLLPNGKVLVAGGVGA